MIRDGSEDNEENNIPKCFRWVKEIRYDTLLEEAEKILDEFEKAAVGYVSGIEHRFEKDNKMGIKENQLHTRATKRKIK